MATTQNQPAAGAPFTINGTRRVRDVDAVDDIAGYARVNGREVAVHHADAITWRMIRESELGIVTDETPCYDAVQRHCPELTRDEIDRLSTTKIGVIIGIATVGIKEVEAQIPNAEGPAETTEVATATSSPPA